MNGSFLEGLQWGAVLVFLTIAWAFGLFLIYSYYRRKTMTMPAPTQPQSVPPVPIKPGEQTTEYDALRSSQIWGQIMILMGTFLGVAMPALDLLLNAFAQIPPEHQTHTMTLVASGCSFLVSIFGALKKVIAERAYIQARTDLKIAALPPAPVS